MEECEGLECSTRKSTQGGCLITQLSIEHTLKLAKQTIAMWPKL